MDIKNPIMYDIGASEMKIGVFMKWGQKRQISGNFWTIPADLVKGQKNKTTAFRVPLPEAALEVVERAKRSSTEPQPVAHPDRSTIIVLTKEKNRMRVFLRVLDAMRLRVPGQTIVGAFCI